MIFCIAWFWYFLAVEAEWLKLMFMVLYIFFLIFIILLLFLLTLIYFIVVLFICWNVAVSFAIEC